MLHLAVDRERRGLPQVDVVSKDAGDLGQILDPRHAHRAEVQAGPLSSRQRFQESQDAVGLRDVGQRGEDRIGGIEEEEQVALRIEAGPAFGVQRVAGAALEQRPDAGSVLPAIPIGEERSPMLMAIGQRYSSGPFQD